jgi:hypothetical protein
LKKIVFILFLILLGNLVKAQDPFYRLIGKGDGLPSNSVYDIFQDKKGFIWCAHNEGLSRYDGFGFESFFSDKQSSRAGSYIREDKFGRIWYSNFDGYIYYVENDSMKELKMKAPFGYTRYGISDEFIYVIVQNGIDIYDLKQLNLVKSVEISLKNLISAISFNNKFYIQLDNLLVIDGLEISKTIDYKSNKDYISGLGIIHSTNNKILITKKENLCENGLILDDKNNFTFIKFPFKGFFQNYSITDDKVWACAQSGVWGISLKTGIVLNGGKPLFSDFNVSYVFKDRSENYWFTTLSDGLIFVPNLEIKRVAIGTEKPFKLIEKDNGVVIGTRSGMVLYNDLKGHNAILSKAKQHEIISLVYDSIGRNIFFTERGFTGINKNNKEFYSRPFSCKDVIRVDDYYFAYASSGSIGLFNFTGEFGKSEWDSIHLNNITEKDIKISAMEPRTIRGKSVAIYKPLNLVFFATNLGLFTATPKGVNELKFKQQSFFVKELQSGLNRVFCLNGNGSLFEIKKGAIIQEIAAPENIKDIKLSGNFLFLITEDHLYQINLLIDGNKISQLEYIAKGQEINDIVFIKNQLIVATNQGLVISEKNENESVKIKPKFYIKSVNIGGRKAYLNSDEEFEFDENDVEIFYSVLNFNKANELPVYYRINNGLWLLCSPNTRMLFLPALSSGRYNIEFRIGSFSTENTFITFRINRPFYFQAWFILLFLLFITFILTLLYRIRVKRMAISNQLKLEKIELQKSLGQSMLTAIKSQMNPHFFYNALNTIQSFIYSDDKKMASSYLAKFSKLTRMILEMSEKENVNLSDELLALQLYLELEEVRFEETDFHYFIITDEDLDMEMVQIPSMMIQPYVENAIKHGLLHKSGKKDLAIRIRQDVGILVVEVEDNGVGREKSAKINASKNEKWTSFSTGANEKRLEILNRGRSKAIGVKIHDKYENQIGSGTIVKISIPLNN